MVFLYRQLSSRRYRGLLLLDVVTLSGPSPELLQYILGNVKGRILLEPFDCSLKVDQASMVSLFENTESRRRFQAALLGCLVTFPLVDKH
jgi:hypothetical protein